MIVGARGEIIAEAGTDEETLVGDVDVDAVRRTHGACLWADRFRRPETYGILSRTP